MINWFWRRVQHAICLIILLLGVPQAFSQVRSSPVVVGDAKNPGTLEQAILEAYSSGARNITIRRGVYYVPSSDSDVIRLDHWRDAIIRAYGVTIIAGPSPGSGAIFYLDGCNDVTIEGPLLSATQITVYQGRVTAINPGDGKPGDFSCVWTGDPGYPVWPAGTIKFPFLNIVDSKTKLLKTGTSDYYSISAQQVGPNSYSLSGFGGTPDIAVGDWLLERFNGPIYYKVHLDGCQDCTIKDVSMMRNGFAPIFETGGLGGDHILGCKWLIGPTPAGGTVPPLASTMADGFHSADMGTGPDIENCYMEGIFGDDCFAIHGSFDNVISSSGSTLVLKGGGWKYKVGQPITVCDSNGLYAKANVTAETVNGDGTVDVTIDTPINASSAAKAFDPNWCGSGYKIINCRLGETRSRGILVKGSDGLIQGCTIYDTGMPAISIGPEFYWGEAGYVDNVIVKDNTIVQCGAGGGGGSAIYIHGEGSMGNSNITVKNNRFVDNYLGEFDVEWSKNVTISGNHVLGLNLWPSNIGKPAFATVNQSTNVTFLNNTVKNQSVYKRPLVDVRDNVTGLTGDDSKGIRAAN